METWRQIILAILMIMSTIDLVATYLYVNRYREWQPNKPYNMIEKNPLLVFLWNNFGLEIGMIIGAVIIWALIFLIGKSAHPIIIGILFLTLSYAIYNHYINTNLLNKLIQQYPTGHLPKETFGEVVGNN